MFKKSSIHIKFIMVFLATVLLVSMALMAGLYKLRLTILHDEAQVVANQVVAFRSWVARSGMIWVDHLSENFHDFLASKPGADGKTIFYGKNPALATRELSEIVKASKTRATFRVTSDKYRNPANAPDPFEATALGIFKADPSRSYYDALIDDQYRYAQPIYITKECLKCHGKASEAPPEVIQKYGTERAFDYKVGEVRGIISVQVPDITLNETLSTLANPITFGLLILAFIVSYLYVDFGVIRRLRRLTRSAEAIAEGYLDTPLEYDDPQGTHNEIDKLYYAVHLLRNSLQVAMRRLQR
jgi:hypothetical protein